MCFNLCPPVQDLLTPPVVHICGGETFSIGVGDILYVEEGTTIDFEMSDDFEDITMLVSDKPVAWR
ncbi:MAG: hypothetical protein F4X92_03600 [Gammaproteobacteria bacterium]|nr:hypothetical protein [Gammaproteobacteria bacterium]